MNKFLNFFRRNKNVSQQTQPQENDYGIVKGLIKQISLGKHELHELKYHKKHKFPHFNFTVAVDDQIYTANINVQSRNPQSPNLKIFYTENPQQDLKNLNPFNKALALNQGAYHHVGQDQALDYLRGNYFDLNKLIIPTEPGKTIEKDVLTDILNKYISQGQQNNDCIVLWGSLYQDSQKMGIHNIHMNQGNPQRLDENGIWQDGGFMICDEKTIKFVCFLTFAEQCLSTDDKGNCK